MRAILSRRPRSSSFLHCRVSDSYVRLGGSPRTHDKELRVFYLSYIGAELRRRAGRTALTALGLGVGVGLVVTVTALSNGLDDAQQKVLKPLTGVGTDMSVTRPLRVSGSGSGQTFTPGGGGGPARAGSAAASAAAEAKAFPAAAVVAAAAAARTTSTSPPPRSPASTKPSRAWHR